MIILYLLTRTLYIFCSAVTLIMMLQSLMSMLMLEGGGVFYSFLCSIVAVVTAPMRIICDRMGWFQETPLDMPHMITFIVLIILRLTIPEVSL